MTAAAFSKALGNVDEKYVEEAATYTQAKARTWRRWAVLAACLALVVAVGAVILPVITNPGAQHEGRIGIYVNGRLYFPVQSLSETATWRNVGAFIGYVTTKDGTASEQKVYAYIPEDGQTNRIITGSWGNYTVYEFEYYVTDDSDDWLKNILANTAYIQIRDEIAGNHNHAIRIEYSSEQEVVQIIDFLTALTPHTLSELDLYQVEKYQSVYGETDITFDENGDIIFHSPNAQNKLTAFICENECTITFIMQDCSEMLFHYYPNIGSLTYLNHAYYLSNEQIDIFNNWITP